MTNILSSFVLWCLLHQQTLAAITLTALIAFVAGAAYQFCADDKQKNAHRSAIR